jgi:hypothetical protein
MATMIAWCSTPWLLSVRMNERRSLQRQSPHSLIWRKPLHISSGCLSTSAWGAIPNICCNLSMRNVFVLIYGDSLNIPIVCSRCMGTYGSPCIFCTHWSI